MYKFRLFVLMLIALLVTMGNPGAASADSRNFTAHLSGSEEVPPRDTLATGQAFFQLSKDGTALEFRLIVANIENVVAAHIHCSSPGVNGPVVAFLYPGPTVSPNGVLSEGTLTGVIPRPDSASCPGGVADFDDLIDKMNSGAAYVNVHTDDGVAPPNTGPGDFPGGEIRGQIQ